MSQIPDIARRAQWCALSIVVLIAALLAVGCTGSSPAANTAIAARYNGGEITEEAVSAYTADFRVRNGLEDDKSWAEYLVGEGITVQEWRERAIGSLVEDELIAHRAEELGIKPDEERIESQIASDREAAGLARDDVAGWESHLESIGKSPQEYRGELEATSIKQQVLSAETQLDSLEGTAILDDYIQTQLAPRVVRRYQVLVYDTRQAALDALADMSGLSGESLDVAFKQHASTDDSEQTTPERGGDMGWDIANNLGDVQNELNSEMVDPGTLSQTTHELDGKHYVFYCVNRFAFQTDSTFDGLPDDDLRQYVRSTATYDNWSKIVSNYISGLRDAAEVMVSPMPDGLPYDVDTSQLARSAATSAREADEDGKL